MLWHLTVDRLAATDYILASMDGQARSAHAGLAARTDPAGHGGLAVATPANSAQSASDACQHDLTTRFDGWAFGWKDKEPTR